MPKRLGDGKDIVLENLKGFVRKGAVSNIPGNVPTGHFVLDFVIHNGVTPDKVDLSKLDNGDMSELGIPRAKVVELFGEEGSGKSSLAYRVVGYGQKMGLLAAWIDTENSFSDDLAKINGVDMENLYYANMCNELEPDKMFYAEDVFDAIIRLCQSGVKIIVLDSVADLVPKERMEKDADKAVVGKIARLMSENLGKIVNYAALYGSLVIFINQLREKIGIMWGCLHADTIVNFVDGRSFPIKQVVDEKITGKVWSYDTVNDEFIAKEIMDWHYNGDVELPEDYLSISIVGTGTKNGLMNITVTPYHLVLTDNGWIAAEDIGVGSRLVTKQESINSGTFGGFLRGVLSGDSHISRADNHLSANLRIRDNVDLEYARWKVSKLNKYMRFSEYTTNGGFYYISKSFSELTDLQCKYPNRDPMILLDDFDWRGFAIWIMDDASYNRGRYDLSFKRFKGNYVKIEQISSGLDSLGLYHHASSGGHIVFDTDVSDKIAQKIAEFVPICMSHKLPYKYQGMYQDFELQRNKEYSLTYGIVSKVRNASKIQMRNIGKYDISVEGTECYMAGGSDNGVIVHNSPETTPGGHSLKHNASLRIQLTKQGKGADIYRHDDEMDKEVLIGRKVRVHVRKNRFAKPFLDSLEIPIYYEPYFPDIEEMLFDVGRQLKLITVRNMEYTWKASDGTVHKVDGKNGFIDYIKSTGIQQMLAGDIVAKSHESNVILPPEVAQWYKQNIKQIDEGNNSVGQTVNAKSSSGRRKRKDSEVVSDNPDTA